MSPTYLQNIAAKMAAQHADLVAKYGENFDAPAEQFGLNVAEACVINEWIESLRPEIMALQGKTYSEISPDEPYYGATGGGLSYRFTPTSLGTIIVVKEAITGKELNVTDALGWYFYG
jgi:hypothetical protein